jgi:hypothetical protein
VAYKFYYDKPKDGLSYVELEIHYPRAMESGRIILEKMIRYAWAVDADGETEPGLIGDVAFKIPDICPFCINKAEIYWASNTRHDGILKRAVGRLQNVQVGNPKCPRCVCAFADLN